jgi:malate/lactate dehydrogenase
VPSDLVVGSGASAVLSAARSLLALELDGSSKDVSVNVVGRPGAFVIAWSSANVAGSCMTEHLPAHRMLAVSDRLAKLGAPGPQSLGAAAAHAATALAFGGRQRVSAFTVLDGEYDVRGRAAMLPLELGQRRIVRRILPSLSTQERVQFLNGLERR